MHKGGIFVLRPLVDKIVVKMLESEDSTKSGIILTSGSKEKSKIAEVIEVGPEGRIDGNIVEMYVKKGDKVIINKYAGSEFKYNNEDYIVVKQSDVLVIVD